MKGFLSHLATVLTIGFIVWWVCMWGLQLADDSRRCETAGGVLVKGVSGYVCLVWPVVRRHRLITEAITP